MTITDMITPLVISAVTALAIQWGDNKADAVTLRANTEAVKELTQAVQELKTSSAVGEAKFVTRDYLDQRLKENSHGS